MNTVEIFQNRTRFALTLVKRLKTVVPDMVIDYKLPIVTPLGENAFRGKGGLPFDEGFAFLQKNWKHCWRRHPSRSAGKPHRKYG